MEDNRNLLCRKTVSVTDSITIQIPTVRDVLEQEQEYYSLIQEFTASPYSMMVQLDDAGIDFTTITEYQLFLMGSRFIFLKDLSLIFGDTFSNLRNILLDDSIDATIKEQALFIAKHQDNNNICLYDAVDGILIDEYIYDKIATILRRINLIKKDNRKVGNEKAKEYLIAKYRRYQNRHKNDEYKPFLENYVVALVNKQEFKYNYEETMDLPLYQFNRSMKQIQHTVNFDKITSGIYAGTVDTSKIADKSILSFIET